MKKAYALSGIIILLLVLVPAGMGGSLQADENENAATLIKTASLLEQKPLDKDAKERRSWALKWLIDTDKVTVSLQCLMLDVDKKYQYKMELYNQYMIGMAAYKLSNPGKAQDEDAAQLAGIESAITSYQAIVAEQPKATNAFMDDLQAKRSQGTLAAYVKQYHCKKK